MLERLFTSKTRIRIMGFLFFEKESTYLREIARATKISPNAVKRELDNFLEIGLVIKKNRQIRLNENCPILEELKNILIKTDYIFYPIRNVFEKNKKASFVLIFGSFARGNYNYNSDVDLLIIGKIKLSEAYKLLKPVEKKVKRSINPVVWTIENLRKEKNSGFIKDIFKKGAITIKGDENEIQKIIR